MALFHYYTTDRPISNKLRGITIQLKEIYKDIDAHTYKYAEVSTVPSPRAKNEMQSDTTTDLDGGLLSRNVEYRDAKLRSVISFAIADDTVLASATNERSEDGNLLYNLILPLSFKDSLLHSIAVLIHRYLVYGALYDWYGAGLGVGQRTAYEDELKEIERELCNRLRATSVVKKPHNPFPYPKSRY